MLILIFWSLVFLITSLRWYTWACEDFANRKAAQAWFFLLGSLIWMGFAGALALVSVA